MRTFPSRAPALALACSLLAGLSGCLRNPNADAETAEALSAIGEEVTTLKQENSDLQGQIDSLRVVVARQDTLTRRLASMAGVPVP